MNRYESDYCSYQAPSEWVPDPPFGFCEPGGAEGRMRVQLIETWLATPRSAADHAGLQKEALPHLLQEFELVDEGSYQPSGPGDGHFLRYRYFSDEGDTTIETRIILTRGPLLCELTLTRLGEGDEESARILNAIGRTLTLQNTDFLEKTQSLPLMSEAVGTDAPNTTRESRLRFPRSCVSVPQPEGWEVAEDDGDVVFTQGGSTIRLHRHLGGLGDAGTWLRERMKGLQQSGSSLLGSEDGELTNGSSYAALLSDPAAMGRSWNSAAEKRALHVFVEDQQPLEWSLLCPRESFEVSHPVLQRLVAGTELLDPSDWETKLAEPWVDLTLTGGWRAEGDGLYAKTDGPFVFLYLSRLPCKAPLDVLSPSIVDNIRQGVQTVVAEDEAHGLWHQKDSFRYSLDGVLEDGREVFVRTVWVIFEEEVYVVMIQGLDQLDVESLLKHLLEGLRIASAASSSR